MGRYFVYCLLIFIAGCTTVGDVIIASHPQSHRDKESGRPLLKVGFCGLESGGQQSLEAVDDISGVAAKFLLDQIERSIELESKKYSSTYSARTSGFIYDLGNDSMMRKLCSFTFKRIAKKDNAEADYGLEVFGLLDIADSAIKVRIDKVKIESVRSKVADSSWYPWHWLSSLVILPWKLIDSDVSKVDLNIQVNLEVIAKSPKDTVQLVKVGSFDFPIGKVSMKELEQGPKVFGNLQEFDSGFLPLPSAEKETTDGERSVVEADQIPFNLTVSVIESNDLGDVIGKGLEKFREKRPELKKKLDNGK